MASELKVADLISAWDKTSSPYLSWSLDYSQRSPVNTPKWFKEACEKLIQIGLTRVEWIALPSSTVSLDALRSLGKEDLLKKRVLMLGTLSYKALKAVSSQLGKFPHLVTIEDLLSTTEDQWGFILIMIFSKRNKNPLLGKLKELVSNLRMENFFSSEPEGNLLTRLWNRKRSTGSKQK